MKLKRILNWFKSTWRYTCPRCQKGEMFIKPLNLSKPLAMNEVCGHCGQQFEPEPGYYFGAMFISYIVGSFIVLPIALVLVFVFDYTVEAAILWVILLGALLYLKLLRGARSLWIHLLVKYEETDAKN